MNWEFSTLQAYQSPLSGRASFPIPYEAGANGTLSNNMPMRSMVCDHPGLSSVSILMPYECSQSPSHWSRYQAWISSISFIRSYLPSVVGPARPDCLLSAVPYAFSSAFFSAASFGMETT